MATTKAQRWGILTILIVTVVGTIGSFAVMGFDLNNSANEASRQQDAMNKYTADYKEYQKKVEAQGVELSAKYFDTFKEYSSRVAEFDRDGVKELKTEDLKIGDGAEITGTTKFAAYYIGWNPLGKVFDQSIDGDKLKSPLPVATGLDEAGLIEGWKAGMKGVRIGGVREITIPSDKAYGEKGQGDDIPANTPLKFVVMAIPAPTEIPQPEIPAELLQRAY